MYVRDFQEHYQKLNRMAKNLDVFLYDQEQTAAANLDISDR